MSVPASEADPPFRSRPCPDWYAGPQLGIFIHWGVFAVPGWAPPGVSIADLFRTDYWRAAAISPYAEWYWNAMRVPGSPTEARHRALHGEAPYEAFQPDFEQAAEAFNADRWADLFVASGARYVVMVTKHHDGYCLWPSAVPHPTRSTWRSKRDFVGELAEAVRGRGLRFGVYYSGGLDWTFRHVPISTFGDMFACVPTDAAYRAYANAQVRELIARYQPSVLWNDIAWPHQEDLPALFADYYAAVPDGVVNDRWMANTSLFEGLHDAGVRRGFDEMIAGQIAAASGELESPAPWHCDFRTVEYTTGAHMGAQKWESCRGLGLAFGYNQAEQPEDFMTGDELIALYRNTTGRGGNLLINVGPMADGTIPPLQSRPLLELGRVVRGG